MLRAIPTHTVSLSTKKQRRKKMIGTRIVKVNDTQQSTLENLYLLRIREINEKLRKFYATYNDWENADERIRDRYTREQYKEMFIDYQLTERHIYIIKLRNVRRGIITE